MVDVEALYIIGIGHRAYLHQLAVEVEHMARPGALVEVVDVLGDDIDIIVFLELDEGLVGAVGHGLELGVAAETVGRGHLHHGVVLPQAVGVAEGLYA